jgi:hypothetical protein
MKYLIHLIKLNIFTHMIFKLYYLIKLKGCIYLDISFIILSFGPTLYSFTKYIYQNIDSNIKKNKKNVNILKIEKYNCEFETLRSKNLTKNLNTCFLDEDGVEKSILLLKETLFFKEYNKIKLFDVCAGIG